MNRPFFAGFPQPSAHAMTRSWASNLRHDAVGGLVSSAIAIPLAVGFGMFAFVTLGDEYFAYGALAGLTSAFVVGVTCVLLGDKTPTVYAPRVTTTFFKVVAVLAPTFRHGNHAIGEPAAHAADFLRHHSARWHFPGAVRPDEARRIDQI